MGNRNTPDGPDDYDAIFGEIVADLRAEGVGTREDVHGATEPEPSDVPPPDDVGGGWRPGGREWDETMLDDDPEDDDEHFVPPEPPPIPRPPGSVFVTGLFFIVGLILLIAPNVIGLGTAIATPLGILSMAAGIGFLLLHARDDQSPPGADPDSGAQV